MKKITRTQAQLLNEEMEYNGMDAKQNELNNMIVFETLKDLVTHYQIEVSDFESMEENISDIYNDFIIYSDRQELYFSTSTVPYY